MRLVVNIDVDDLDRAIAFYSALGLRLGRRLFEGSAAEMTGGDTLVHLLLKPAGSAAAAMAATPRRYDRHWTPVHLDFQIEDIETALHDATAAGARAEGGIQSFSWGRLATLSDPFGNGFCLVQLTQAGYDAASESGRA